jgi:proteasome accessory factor A
MMQQPLMGSETEYGLVPIKPLLREWSILDHIQKEILGRANFQDSIELRELASSVNWWEEDLNLSELEKKPELISDVLRRMGVTGNYLANGARFYIDGSHLEYSTPECSDPLELVAHERAGERIVWNALKQTELATGEKAYLLKRNWDYHKVSYACHENYLVSRGLFQALTERSNQIYLSDAEKKIWVTHLISRQIYTGSGRLDPELSWPDSYSLSQRQPFIQHLEAVDTTRQRAIINTRDRPYADHRYWARLHVICGDSNRSDWSNALKYGISRLILLMLDESEKKFYSAFWGYLDNPVESFREIKSWESDVWKDFQKVTALSAQRTILHLLRDWHRWREEEGRPVSWANREMDRLQLTLDLLEKDSDSLSGLLDYNIKRKIFEERLSQPNLKKDTLEKLDFSYHLVGPNSLFERLLETDRAVTLVEREAISVSEVTPPKGRPELRKKISEALQGRIDNRSWHFITAREGERSAMIRLTDPFGRAAFCDNPEIRKLLKNLVLGEEGSER